MSAWVLIPPSKPKLSNFFCLPRHWESSQVPPGRQKALIIPIVPTCLAITLIISKQPTHTLIPWWCHAQELFGSQIPVTTGGFELWISCIRTSYLTHEALRSNRLGGFRVPECKRFAVKPSCGHCKLWSTNVCSQARHHRSFKLGSKLKYLNISIPRYIIQVI